MKTPIVIASYPRSGSTYLKLLLCHCYYPDIDHDVKSANRHIPTLESKSEVLQMIERPKFFKTHQMRNCQNVIFLHRHVGDCLVSEFHYQKDFHGYEGDIEQFLERLEYGLNWRNMVDHYWPCESICFEELISKPELSLDERLFHSRISVDTVKNALKKCNFDKLNKDNPDFFRSGKTGQWKALDDVLQARIMENNWKELKLLGYKI